MYWDEFLRIDQVSGAVRFESGPQDMKYAPICYPTPTVLVV